MVWDLHHVKTTDQSQNVCKEGSQISILVYYKPDWPYVLTTQTLYEAINQVVGFCVQDSVECACI